MGMDVYHSAVLGYAVGSTESEIRVAGCRHSVTPGAKFCGECGAKASTTRKTRMLSGGDRLGAFKVVGGGGSDEQHYVVGIASESSSNDLALQTIPMSHLKDIESTRKAIRAELEAIGITPDESTFGFHSVLYLSY